MTKTERFKKILPDIIIILTILIISFLVRSIASNGYQTLSDPDSYFYLREARTGMEENWTWSQWMNYERINDAYVNPVNCVRGGGVTPLFLSMLLAGFCRLFSIPASSMEQVAYWFSPVLSGLASIPVYFFLKKRIGRYGATASAALIVTAPTFLLHTWPGYFDTDILLVVLPISAILLMAEAIIAETLKKQVLYSLGSTLMMIFLSGTWGTYTMYWLGSMFLGALGVLFCALLKKGKTALRGYGIYLLIMNLCLFLVLGQNYKFALSSILPSSILNIPVNTIVHDGIWPSNSIFVSEWTQLPLIQNIGTAFSANASSYFGLLGGAFVLLMAAVGAAALVISYVRQFLHKSSLFSSINGKDLAVTSSMLIAWAAITLFKVMPKGYRFAFMALLPTALLAGIGIGIVCEWIKQNTFGKTLFPSALWILCTAVIFTALLGFGILPALTGVLIISVVYLLEQYLLLEKTGRILLNIVLCISLAIPSLTCAIAYQDTNQPLASTAVQEAADWIRDNSEEDAIVASWWDAGYYYEYEADRKSLGDGGQFDGWFFTQLAKALMAEDSAAGAKQIKELCGSEDRPVYLIITPEDIERMYAISYYAFWDSDTGTSSVPDSLKARDYLMTRLYNDLEDDSQVFTKVFSAEDNTDSHVCVWKINS
ncbi:MAG: hypothetical protein LKE48_08910 [Solobacterium sp.]|nr:hypothetical protein [Solobacterium sp.]